MDGNSGGKSWEGRVGDRESDEGWAWDVRKDEAKKTKTREGAEDRWKCNQQK